MFAVGLEDGFMGEWLPIWCYATGYNNLTRNTDTYTSILVCGSDSGTVRLKKGWPFLAKGVMRTTDMV